MASPASHQGHELAAAGLLLIPGAVDGDQLRSADMLRTRQRSLEGYDPSR
jgi:hypothetical protein